MNITQFICHSMKFKFMHLSFATVWNSLWASRNDAVEKINSTAQPYQSIVIHVLAYDLKVCDFSENIDLLSFTHRSPLLNKGLEHQLPWS